MKLRLPKNRFLRWGIYLAALAGAGMIVALGLRWNTYRQSAAELQAEIDRLNAEDPGWEWAPLQANRPPIPEGNNSFAVIEKILAKSNVGRYDYDPNLDQWRVLPEGMPIEVAEWAGEYVAERGDAILIARKLAAYPTGRHPIKYSPDFIGTLLPTVNDTRQIANLLQWDIRVNAQLGKFDLCIDDLRAMRNAARSFGDEGFTIVMHVRIAIDTVAAKMTGEMLSQGEAPESGLAILQRELLEESREPILVTSLRSERAIALEMMRSIAQKSDLHGTVRMMKGIIRDGPPSEGSILDDLSALSAALQYLPLVKADQAYMLRRFSETRAALQLPAPQRLARLAEMEQESKAEKAAEGGGLPNLRHLMTNLLTPAVEKVAAADMRWQASLRSAAAAIAAERFRMANKRWPNDLAELVPKYMERVEEDPFTAKPLMYKKFADGIAVYSVGSNLVDDGGDVVGAMKPEGRARGDYAWIAPTDIGTRLWNVEKRGTHPANP